MSIRINSKVDKGDLVQVKSEELLVIRGSDYKCIRLEEGFVYLALSKPYKNKPTYALDDYPYSSAAKRYHAKTWIDILIPDQGRHQVNAAWFKKFT